MAHIDKDIMREEIKCINERRKAIRLELLGAIEARVKAHESRRLKLAKPVPYNKMQCLQVAEVKFDNSMRDREELQWLNVANEKAPYKHARWWVMDDTRLNTLLDIYEALP